MGGVQRVSAILQTSILLPRYGIEESHKFAVLRNMENWEIYMYVCTSMF